MQTEPLQTEPLQTVTLSPSSRKQLRVWLLIGLQSFEGGAATLALVRRVAVREQGWLTEEEFLQEWSLCQVAPGINLLALAVLVGNRLAGARGILLALTGLLFPSVSLTVLLSAGFAQFHRLPAGPEILHGLLPATVGLGLLTASQMARTSHLVSFHKEPRFVTLD